MTDATDKTSDQPHNVLLQVSSLSDRFEVSANATSSIADLKAKLLSEKFGAPVELFLEDGGQKLSDSDLIGDLPAGVNLLCLASSLGLLEKQLGELESPGDPYQKYLRTYEGVSAGDLRVLRSVWALACLDSTSVLPLDQVAAAVIIVISLLWAPFDVAEERQETIDGKLIRCEPLSQQLIDKLPCADVKKLEGHLHAHYSFEAHEKLLSWLLENPDKRNPGGSLGTCARGEPSPRLRVMLAEIHQILCRGVTALMQGEGNSRQTEAYAELLKIAMATSEPLVHMRAFGQ